MTSLRNCVVRAPYVWNGTSFDENVGILIDDRGVISDIGPNVRGDESVKELQWSDEVGCISFGFLERARGGF